MAHFARRHRLVLVAALTIVLGSWAPSVAFGQDSTPIPPAASCHEEPRTLVDFQSLAQTSGPIQREPTSMPDGSTPDAATVAAITATIADFAACSVSGEYYVQLGFFTDQYLQGFITTYGLTPDQINDDLTTAFLQSIPDFSALRHLRLVGDERVALVATTVTYELLYLELVSTDDRWLVDVAVFLPLDEDNTGQNGFLGRTYTDRFTGIAVEWDESWTPVSPDAAPMITDLALDNGVGLLMFRWSWLGIESLKGNLALDQCIQPPSVMAFTAGTVDMMDPEFITVVVDGENRPLRGIKESSGFGVYNLHYFPLADFDLEAGETNPAPRDYRLYVECRVLPDDSLIQITHLVPKADYQDQIPARKAVFALLEL